MRGDLARLLRVTFAREALPPDEPEVLRFFGALLWRWEQRMRPGRWEALVAEARATFGVSQRTAVTMAREAADLSLQMRLEELVVPRCDATALDRHVNVDGEVRGRALVLSPTAGNTLLLTAALSWRCPGLVCLRRPPTADAHDGFALRLARRFEAEETRLPVLWESDPDAVPAHLAAGRTVVATFDDRTWPDLSPTPFFGRPALLSPFPWRIARESGVPIVPAFIHRDHDKSNHVAILPAVAADPARYLHEVAEPWLRLHAGHYLPFLAACRLGLTCAPLFVDRAPPPFDPDAGSR